MNDYYLLGETSDTRKVLRIQWVRNRKNENEPVRAWILHQRRHSRSGEWRDPESFTLASLKAGQEVKIELPASYTQNLFNGLKLAYAVHTKFGFPDGERSFTAEQISDDDDSGSISTVVKAVRGLIQEDPNNFEELLSYLVSDLPKSVAVQKLHAEREVALRQFRDELNANRWDEKTWQRFFCENQWIFGYGLDYQFMNLESREAPVSGPDYSDSNQQQADFLLSTVAQVGFTVIVDIKRPNTSLMDPTIYRNYAYRVSQHLAGGVAQVQSYCRNWAIEGSQRRQNSRRLESRGILTCEPRGYLVIGHTNELAGKPELAESFELFRTNLRNPQVITYDELLARASFIVENTSRYA